MGQDEIRSLIPRGEDENHGSPRDPDSHTLHQVRGMPFDGLINNHQKDGFVKSSGCQARKHRGVKATPQIDFLRNHQAKEAERWLDLWKESMS
jgi:hypothetical protein